MMAKPAAAQPTPHILYGGTFDPVHDGHLAVALAASTTLNADVFMVPSADPPHRAPPGASAEHRAAMLDLAVEGHPRLHVDRRELRRAGRSYSVDTLTEVRAEIGPDAPLVWLLGADAMRDLHQWHRWRELFALAHLLIAVRPRHALEGFDPELQAETAPRWTSTVGALARSPAGLLMRLDLMPRHEAATNLRQRIADGLLWQDDVASAVADYIEAYGLYGA